MAVLSTTKELTFDLMWSCCSYGMHSHDRVLYTLVLFFIMTPIFILNAQWILSLFSCRAESKVFNMRQGQIRSDESNHNTDSEENKSLTETQLYNLYAEFYENMEEEELHNLDNYLERE